MSAVPHSAPAPAIRPQRPRSRRRSWPRALAGMCLVALFVGWPMMPASLSATAPPPVPTDLTATPGDGQVTLSWSRPADGGPVYGYDIYQGTTSGGESDSPINTSPVQGTTSYTAPSLTDGTTYYFTVAAVYDAGKAGKVVGLSSAEASATTLPAPTGLTATLGDAQVTLSWSPPVLKGVTVDSYDIYQGTSPGGESHSPVNTSPVQGTSYTAPGLTDGTTYYFTVAAVWSSASGVSLGQGPSSGEASATPVAATQLGAPTGLTATPGDAQVTLSWSPPVLKGVTVDSYDIYQGTSPGGESHSPVNTSPVQGTSYTAPGLTDGTTYYFTVAAVWSSASGETPVQGPSSGEASATPVAATQLGAPTGLTATPGDAQVTLSWSPPVLKGVTVDSYDIYQGTSPGGESHSPVNTSPVQGTSYTAPGLTDGTTYYFTVAAVWSSASGKRPSRAPHPARHRPRHGGRGPRPRLRLRVPLRQGGSLGTPFHRRRGLCSHCRKCWSRWRSARC